MHLCLLIVEKKPWLTLCSAYPQSDVLSEYRPSFWIELVQISREGRSDALKGQTRKFSAL